MAPPTSTFELPSVKELQSSEQLKLLDVVDQLRAHGLGEITALPQLIVCGDQSSGKSSVLEAISGVPFPQQEGACTRFATEVILRRSTRHNIKISIVPSQDRSGEERQQALDFQHELTDHEDFERLFESAKTIILSGTSRTFSKDILRIELSGPRQPQLTLVDVPGLIHASSDRQAAVDGVRLVTELVDSYLKNPRSIILAIVSAKNDYANQIVLSKARAFDPEGLRTLGIITKPDKLTKDSQSENDFLRLARNEEFKFQLGWHVVKNIDSQVKDSQQESRDEQETTFFRESNFSNLPSGSVGIATLRTRLGKVLFNQIRTELPRLLADIERRMSAAELARDKIGPGRPELDDQKDFLIDLSDKFQQICRSAVRGDYDHEFFRIDPDGEKRLCANVMNQHSQFAERLREKGAKWKIVDDEGSGSFVVQGQKSPDNRTRKEAIQEVVKLLKDNRGWELPGLPNPLVVGGLFREYSQPWAGLALNHIQNVWDTTNRFLELVLLHLTEADVFDKIHRVWLYPKMEEKLHLARDKLKELLEVHDEHPFTRNRYFMDNRKEIQRKNLQKGAHERVASDTTKFTHNIFGNDVAHVALSSSNTADIDMDLIAAEDAFDNMNAYYQVAISLFTDNVPMLAVQAPILRSLHEILTPKVVSKMEVEVITQIAGESEDKARERSEILHKLATLEAGARICKQYAMRPHSVLARPSDLKPEVSEPLSSQEKAQNGIASPQTSQFLSSDAGPSPRGGERASSVGPRQLEVPGRGQGVSPGRSRSAEPNEKPAKTDSATARDKPTAGYSILTTGTPTSHGLFGRSHSPQPPASGTFAGFGSQTMATPTPTPPATFFDTPGASFGDFAFRSPSSKPKRGGSGRPLPESGTEDDEL